MAKDGTSRGGARARSGPARKSLADKINDGQARLSLKTDEKPRKTKYVAPDFFSDEQADGMPELIAAQVSKEVWAWLEMNDLEYKIHKPLVTFYAMSVARWVQCERMISRNGLLGKHPTTGQDTTSAYVSMSREYMRQIQATWYSISHFVDENAENAPIGANPNNDLMDKLLLTRPGESKSG